MAAPLSNSFARQVLAGIGAPITPENLRFLRAWAQSEGTAAQNNPFATTHPRPGSTILAGNTSGVRNYLTPSEGITATIATLQDGNYPTLLQSLRSGKSAATSAQALGVAGPTGLKWGTDPALVLKVLGETPTFGQTSYTPSGGGAGISGMGPPGTSTLPRGISGAQPPGKPPGTSTLPKGISGAGPNKPGAPPAPSTIPVPTVPPWYTPQPGRVPNLPIPKGPFTKNIIPITGVATLPNLPASTGTPVDTSAYPDPAAAGTDPGTAITNAVAGAMASNPVGVMPTVPNVNVQAIVNAIEKAAPTVGAHLMGLPPNWQQLVNNALTTIANPNLDYNSLLNAATKQATAYIAPQLLPIQQQYQQGVGTINTYARGALQAEQGIANQVGQYYDQAAATTRGVSQAVQAMLASQDPSLGTTGIPADQLPAINQQAAQTFTQGGNVLGGITSMGIPGIEANKAAAQSYAAMLPSILRTQTTQALGNLAGQETVAESNVLAKIPDLATKIASGQLSANKAAQAGAKTMLDWVTGVRKFNLGQLSTRDKTNLQAFQKAIDQAFTGVNAKLRATGLQITERGQQVSAQNAAVRAAISAAKASNPTGALATMSPAQEAAASAWWRTAFEGTDKNISQQAMGPKGPLTKLSGGVQVPVMVTKTERIGALQYNDAVEQFARSHPNMSENDVLALAQGFYRSIGSNGRPLDPLMVDALRAANQPVVLQFESQGKNKPPAAYLTLGQMVALKSKNMVYGSYKDGFTIPSTGQTVLAVDDKGQPLRKNGQQVFVIVPNPPGGPAGVPTPNTGSAAPTTSTPAAQANAQTRSFVTPNGTNVEVQGQVTAKDLAVVEAAARFIGTPYSWGGGNTSGPTYGTAQGANIRGFDCSSLLQYAWAQQGVPIGRTTYQQWQQGRPVSKGQLQPGDAVFFTGSDPQNGLPGHVGMYIGGGKFIEAPHTGADIRISSLAGRTDYVGARSYD